MEMETISFLRKVPLIHTVYTFFDFNLVMPTQGMEFADIGEFAHGTIGFGRIESELSLESHLFHYQVSKVGYRDFLACTYVDVAIAYFATTLLVCILEINVFKYIDTGIGHLFAPKELAHGFACSPQASAEMPLTIRLKGVSFGFAEESTDTEPFVLTENCNTKILTEASED